jgi:hypothetical protein
MTTSHIATTLPTCAICGEAITFYMHQRDAKDGSVAYYHVDCCPEEACVKRRREKLRNAITMHLFESPKE